MTDDIFCLVIGAFACWWFGWAFAYGEGNAFIGYSQFGMDGE